MPRCEADTADGTVCQATLVNGRCPRYEGHAPVVITEHCPYPTWERVAEVIGSEAVQDLDIGPEVYMAWVGHMIDPCEFAEAPHCLI